MKSTLLLVLEFLLLLAGIAVYAFGLFPFPILPLFVIAWISLHLRHMRWRDIGLRRPERWLPIIGLALLIGIGYQALDTVLIAPLLQRLTGQSIDLSLFTGLKGDLLALLVFIITSWTEAAFIEEMFFRGYLINRLMDVAGRERLGITIALLANAIIFGFAHAYQGLTGVLDTGLAGLLLGLLYLRSRRNLWLPILAHGILDTVGFLLIYLGWVS
ncbi:MAG: CPBP family intramembrane glutamic endopeptidase [Anaerolineales bacterium]